MKNKHLISLLQTGFTTIKVEFKQGSQQYTYKAKLSEGIKVEDRVIVDSPQDGLTVVKVVEVHLTPEIDLHAKFDYKWIVHKVDLTDYLATLAQEAEFTRTLLEVERIRQKEELLADFQKYLPEGSAARQLFDKATHMIEGESK